MVDELMIVLMGLGRLAVAQLVAELMVFPMMEP
jgi:hypothetical protein